MSYFSLSYFFSSLFPFIFFSLLFVRFRFCAIFIVCFWFCVVCCLFVLICVAPKQNSQPNHYYYFLTDFLHFESIECCAFYFLSIEHEPMNMEWSMVWKLLSHKCTLTFLLVKNKELWRFEWTDMVYDAIVERLIWIEHFMQTSFCVSFLQHFCIACETIFHQDKCFLCILSEYSHSFESFIHFQRKEIFWVELFPQAEEHNNNNNTLIIDHCKFCDLRFNFNWNENENVWLKFHFQLVYFWTIVQSAQFDWLVCCRVSRVCLLCLFTAHQTTIK